MAISVRYFCSGVGFCRNIEIVLQNICRDSENRIVEIHHVGVASPVGIEHFVADGIGAEILWNLCFEQSPIGVSPAVNALFHVAHNKVEVPVRQAFGQQRAKILPLHRRCVLKLIDHIIVDARARFFVHERRLAVGDDFIEQLGGIRQK